MNDTVSKTQRPLVNFLCFSVYSASHAFNHFYRPLLAELGLTYPQYLVMQLLWGQDGCSVKEIGRDLRLESNTLTPLLKRLEGLNLIVRSRDDEDERVVRVRLTDQGRVMKTRAAHIPECVAEATGLTIEELSRLVRTIDAVRDRLAPIDED
jgi:MarR family transcriptional regulator, organic hydroperoxide resistance regulator